MSLRKPTADEKQELKELKEKYPLKVERYLDIDTVLVLELPYLMLGIDMEGYNQEAGYGGSAKHSLIKEADEIIESAVLTDKLKLQKREIVGFKHDPIRYEYSPYLPSLNPNRVRPDSNPDSIKNTMEYAAALALLPHDVIYKLFRIIDVINWLDKERAIDPRFPLSLPKKLVKYYKEHNEQNKFVQRKLDNYDQINKAPNTIHRLICFLADSFLNTHQAALEQSATSIITDSANKFFTGKLKKPLTEDTVRRILAISETVHPSAQNAFKSR
ncbi:MAG: hypothetical protein LBL30_01125 [Holosporales bacterium]|jgi:hypothetical protein|nr:hypothetical protein [Holosporales bacterium]